MQLTRIPHHPPATTAKLRVPSGRAPSAVLSGLKARLRASSVRASRICGHFGALAAKSGEKSGLNISPLAKWFFSGVSVVALCLAPVSVAADIPADNPSEVKAATDAQNDHQHDVLPPDAPPTEPTSPHAQPAPKPHEPVLDAAVKGALYFQQDSGGQKRVDEDARVFETIILLRGHASPNDTVTAQALVDVVTAASIKREHNARFRALQSGASGVVHLGASLGYHHDFESVGLGVGGSYAWEYAYRSLGAVANVAWHTADKNTTLGFALQSYFDNVLMIRFNGDNEPDETRTTLSATVDWTQILTPASLLTLSIGHTQQFGYLATQYNSVWVDGKETYELLPDGRARESVTFRYKHGVFDADAIEAGLRYYHDDWGADAGTVDLRYFLSFFNRRILLETQYRFHVQTAVDAYRQEFPTPRTYLTSDPDLGEFMGHMAGLKASFTDLDLLGLHSTWDIGGHYYHRDNGLQMFWFQLGYRLSI